MAFLPLCLDIVLSTHSGFGLVRGHGSPEVSYGMVQTLRRMKLKVCLVGDRGVGKTSLLNRYVFDNFSSEYAGTVGSRLCSITLQEVMPGGQLVDAEVAFFDLMGEKGFRDAFKEVMFWGCHGFLAVADLSRRETILSLPGWIGAARSIAGDIPFRILVNKVDTNPESAIGPNDTAWLLDEFPDVPIRVTSARTGEGVERAFDSLLDAMVGAELTRSRSTRAARLVADRILLFAKKRGLFGVGKKEILAAFKEVDHNMLMREVEYLKALGIVTVESTGPNSFRLRLTQNGEKEAERLDTTERVLGQST